MEDWSDDMRAQYIWRAAQKYWAQWILRSAHIELVVHGRENLTLGTPYVAVANHQSVLDILAVVATVPNGRFVAKKEVLTIPIIRGAARYGGQVIVDRGDHEQAMRSLREGMEVQGKSNLVVFPEGTRTKHGGVGKFKYGAFAIAKERNLPIVPIAICGAYDALKKGPLLDLKVGTQIHVIVGEQIPVDSVARYEVPLLAEYARSSIISMLDDIQTNT